MKCVASLRELERYGIIPLTGEADALSYRCLCDLTRQGRQIVAEVFGVREDAFHENWNCGSGDNPHVASVMLPYDAWTGIAPVALMRDCHTVVGLDKQFIGFEDGEEFVPAEWEGWDEPQLRMVQPPKIVRHGIACDLPGKVQRVFRYGSGPRVGSRNVHAMTGRAV